MKSNDQIQRVSFQGEQGKQARYIMIGGFLGAGKTTAIGKFARFLTDQGRKVGLITNDQGQELVDTATLRSQGFSTEEIIGGCFCCRFNSLTEAAAKLSSSTQPDVFIAEPVGSCTDLVATVSYPLRRMHGNNLVISPLSVLVDPVRARRILGLESGAKFSEKVVYLSKKQLEEADVILINKIDLLSESEGKQLHDTLLANYPAARIFEVSARHGQGLEPWFNYLLSASQTSRHAMHVDYEIYGEGEALLGWVNATVKLSCVRYFEPNDILISLASKLQEQLATANAEIAHLKMTLNPDEDLGDVAVINLVRNDVVPELSQKLSEPIESGDLVINLRAEGDPELLHNSLTRSLHDLVESTPNLFARLEHSEYFRPGKPTPTHRLTSA
jgi:G3E family GTPase